jgi:hypothetical protein
MLQKVGPVRDLKPLNEARFLRASTRLRHDSTFVAEAATLVEQVVPCARPRPTP